MRFRSDRPAGLILTRRARRTYDMPYCDERRGIDCPMEVFGPLETPGGSTAKRPAYAYGKGF
jgi:hypothetical protein